MTPEEYQKASEAMTQYRVKMNFDKKYADMGGIAKMQELADQAQTCAQIGEYFGISSTRAGIIIVSVLGMPYSEYLINRKVRRPGVWRKGGDKRGAKPKEVQGERNAA